jgi:hypothetical protein
LARCQTRNFVFCLTRARLYKSDVGSVIVVKLTPALPAEAPGCELLGDADTSEPVPPIPPQAPPPPPPERRSKVSPTGVVVEPAAPPVSVIVPATVISLHFATMR